LRTRTIWKSDRFSHFWDSGQNQVCLIINLTL
jgi:hypothetical protein